MARLGFPLGYGGVLGNQQVEAPYVANILPVAGSALAPTAVLQFDVIAPVTPLRSVIVDVTFQNGDREVVYASGVFTTRYAGRSSVMPLSINLRFSLMRIGGWPSPVVLNVYAINTKGVANDGGTRATRSPNSAPVVSNLSPSAHVTPESFVSFDVTDDSGVLRQAYVYVTMAGSFYAETVFDGTTFTPLYQGSNRSKLANGFRYTLRRFGRWPEAPSVHVIAIDQQGLEA